MIRASYYIKNFGFHVDVIRLKRMIKIYIIIFPKETTSKMSILHKLKRTVKISDIINTCVVLSQTAGPTVR